MLGPSIDLLVWIMKKPGAEHASDMRPLQLPTCFRRLYGAYLAGVLGPVVEELLSRHQAATAGGCCGGNVALTFSHLGHLHPSSAPPADLWWLLLGENGEPIERYSTYSRLPACCLDIVCVCDILWPFFFSILFAFLFCL